MMDLAVAGVGLWVGTDDPRSKPLASLLPRRIRERVSVLSCALAEAFQRAQESVAVDAGQGATVFASAYGETEPLPPLLEQALSPTGEVSPLLFMYSVHNNASGCLSIAGRDRGFTTSIAAGAATLLSGLFESLALLADGWSSVTLIAGDEAPPPVFVAPEMQFRSMAAALHLVAWRQEEHCHLLPRIRIRSGFPPVSSSVPPPPAELARHPCVAGFQIADLIGKHGSGALHDPSWGPWTVEVDSPLPR